MKKHFKEKAVEIKIPERMFVTVNIENETYGVEVSKIQEIIGMTETSHVPNALPFMKGIVNLRGTIVPLIDMRLKFGLQGKAYDKLTVIMIAEIKSRLIGMIVDSILDVVSLTVDSIQDTPHFSSNIRMDCVEGIGKIDDRIIILMNVDKVFSDEELGLIKYEE
jgi:purine-binding chemotaxis protein CheW